MNKYCFLIPSYNHGEALPTVLDGLLHYDIPCLVVNDGSTDGTREMLETRKGSHERLIVLHLPKNCGKGAAVLSGVREALQLGYTHALCIDADGQHEVADVPKFLALSERFPDTIILGDPVFGADIPWERLFFRQISRWLVWLQCLSFAVSDPFCGFRLFPIVRMRQVLLEEVQEMGMGFDIENLVRPHWAGISIQNIQTPVRYPLDGKSHFRYLPDNITIAKLHVRLVLGMLVRLLRMRSTKSKTSTASS